MTREAFAKGEVKGSAEVVLSKGIEMYMWHKKLRLIPFLKISGILGNRIFLKV